MNKVETVHRFELDKTSKKVKCSNCEQKTAVLYIDQETGNYLPEIVQRCDRENKCGHHYTPKKYFTDNPSTQGNCGRLMKIDELLKNQNNQVKPLQVEFIDMMFVEKSMNSFKASNFAEFIISLFGLTAGAKLLLKYFVGRSKNDNGKACVFWQIDESENVRYGKVMSYNSLTGKRKKDVAPFKAPVVPSNYLQTFFGCHLLTEHPNKPVAIVESEKTAIIASFFMPQYNWLATGGSSGCKWREYQVYKVLKGKTIVLFPDFGYYSRPQSKPIEEWKTCYQEWMDRAASISERMPCKISVSKFLENRLDKNLRESGPDLADFFIRQDPHTGIALTDNDYPVIWDYKN